MKQGQKALPKHVHRRPQKPLTARQKISGAMASSARQRPHKPVTLSVPPWHIPTTKTERGAPTTKTEKI